MITRIYPKDVTQSISCKVSVLKWWLHPTTNLFHYGNRPPLEDQCRSFGRMSRCLFHWGRIRSPVARNRSVRSRNREKRPRQSSQTAMRCTMRWGTSMGGGRRRKEISDWLATRFGHLETLTVHMMTCDLRELGNHLPSLNNHDRNTLSYSSMCVYYIFWIRWFE